MYFRIADAALPEPLADEPAEGRFVLHRHTDDGGPHLDLRLETGPFLLGWRIAAGDGADALEGAFAEPKAPHALRWLDEPGPAETLDAGTYRWLDNDRGGGRLLLRGRDGLRALEVAPVPLAPGTVRDCLEAAERRGIPRHALPGLVEDGIEARHRAVARLCGLGRELDGAAFDEEVWRKSLDVLGLAEIHRQLEAFENRFDAKYPPAPVSRPEPVDPPAEEDAARAGRIQAILRGEWDAPDPDRTDNT